MGKLGATNHFWLIPAIDDEGITIRSVVQLLSPPIRRLMSPFLVVVLSCVPISVLRPIWSTKRDRFKPSEFIFLCARCAHSHLHPLIDLSRARDLSSGPTPLGTPIWHLIFPVFVVVPSYVFVLVLSDRLNLAAYKVSVQVLGLHHAAFTSHQHVLSFR